MMAADATAGAGCVHLEISGPVAVLTLDNPPLNVVTMALSKSLAEAVGTIRSHPDVRVAIVTAAGDRAFSAGSDIKEITGLLAPGRAVERKLAPQNRYFNELEALEIPTIAALNGLTLGGGLEIAVCCDLIVADENVLVGSPEIKLGLFPSSGGTFRVARRIGPARAKQLQFLGEPIDAQTALDWGLVNSVVPAGTALQAAKDLAATLIARPRTGLAAVKSLINAAGSDTATLVGVSLMWSERAFTSAEGRAGVAAFMHKQRPDFAEAERAEKAEHEDYESTTGQGAHQR